MDSFTRLFGKMVVPVSQMFLTRLSVLFSGFSSSLALAPTLPPLVSQSSQQTVSNHLSGLWQSGICVRNWENWEACILGVGWFWKLFHSASCPATVRSSTKWIPLWPGFPFGYIQRTSQSQKIANIVHVVFMQDRPPLFKGHPAVVFLHITLLMMDSFDQVVMPTFVNILWMLL